MNPTVQIVTVVVSAVVPIATAMVTALVYVIKAGERRQDAAAKRQDAAMQQAWNFLRAELDRSHAVHANSLQDIAGSIRELIAGQTSICKYKPAQRKRKTTRADGH